MDEAEQGKPPRKKSRVAEKAASIRKELSEAFPGMVFSVRVNSGRTLQSIYVTVHPTDELVDMVQKVIGKYQSAIIVQGATSVTLYWETEDVLQKQIDQALEREDYVCATKIQKKMTKAYKKT